MEFMLLQVVGLGNYILPDTRHSVGMLVVDCLGKQLGATWQFNRKSMGHLAVTKMNDQQLILLKPTVVMNLNGKSISRAGKLLSQSVCHLVTLSSFKMLDFMKLTIKYMM